MGASRDTVVSTRGDRSCPQLRDDLLDRVIGAASDVINLAQFRHCHAVLRLGLWRRATDEKASPLLSPRALELAVGHRLAADPARMRVPVNQHQGVAPV